MPKNAQTTAQLHSSHTLVKECSKFSKPGFSNMWTNHELPDVQAGFRKGRGTRDQTVNIHWFIEKAREVQKNIYFCFIDYTKTFDCVDHNQLWKILKEMGIVNKAEIDVFLELSCFLMIQQMLAIWSLVPLPFLKPAWTSGSWLIAEAWLGEFWAFLY